mmetsp:Transcript_71735/g.149766  ORF Transcript_71735/g.149766 Transcript_71735/m.149766 type:complete len:81 (-) Transcript_71735:174-416(-)
MNSIVKHTTMLFSPKFYQQWFAGVVSRARTDFIAGSPRPLFKGMLLVGVVGYTMEYTVVGRYHVMDKQKIVKEAMASHHH